MEDEYQCLCLVLKEYYADYMTAKSFFNARFKTGFFGESEIRFYSPLFPQLEVTAFEDAARKSLETEELKVGMLSAYMDGNVEVLAQDLVLDIFKDQTGWATFYQMFPEASGLFTVSRVGFNTARNQAVLCVGIQRDWLFGHGDIFWLQKHDKWQIEAGEGAWIS